MNANTPRTTAEWIADFLVARGVERVYGLQGGYIQPIWDFLAQKNVKIFDVRDEGAGVHMAHCHAVLTGQVGIAFATAGPGGTNCVSAIANAMLERVPVILIGGCAPGMQDDLGPLQAIDHVSIMKPVTRSARTLRTADNLLRDLDKAWSIAMGDGNPPGPVYIEIPTDVLRYPVPSALAMREYLAPKQPRRIHPDPDDIARAVALIGTSKRPRPQARLPDGLRVAGRVSRRKMAADRGQRGSLRPDGYCSVGDMARRDEHEAEMPRTATGKILHRVLRERLSANRG